MENEKIGPFEDYRPDENNIIDINNYDLKSFISVVLLLKDLNEQRPHNKDEILSKIEKLWRQENGRKGQLIMQAILMLKKGVLDNDIIESLEDLAV